MEIFQSEMISHGISDHHQHYLEFFFQFSLSELKKAERSILRSRGVSSLKRANDDSKQNREGTAMCDQFPLKRSIIPRL